MKTSRDELKTIVKQCLIEILSEGIGANKFLAPQTQKISGFSEQRTRMGSRQGFDPALDTPVKQPPSQLKEAIRREAGGNKLMESIFADTAATTMMVSGDGGAPVHAMTQQEQFSGNPEQVFGEESAGRWASLAFADSPVKKSA